MNHPQFESIGNVEDRVIEECSELIKAICKAKRFGLGNHHPQTPEQTNRRQIIEEISDVLKVLEKYTDFVKWPCHEKTNAYWCDYAGPGGFMGHVCQLSL